jgi:cytochrome oxidase Cu insertion factor (SCO1/SenC/PrrC family)
MTSPRRFTVALVGLALACTSLSARAADRTEPIPVGEAAPEIKLGDQHGKPFVLGDVLKQHAFVVLAFYPKAFTSG